MRVEDKTSFKAGGLYNITAQVQQNTILNRGLIDLGGCAVPQMVMSNNNDERIERGVILGLYFVTDFLAPFVLLPFFNKRFLSKNGIVKNFTNNERRIIEVSKKHLISDAKTMEEGIIATAEKLELEAKQKDRTINIKQDFMSILNRYKNKDELREKLIKTHEKVLFSDFLTTALMWCSIPWIGMTVTKLRTKRSGFSATYGMIDESESKKNAQKYESEKKKKLLLSGLLGCVPSFIFPKLVTAGMKGKSKVLNSVIKKIPESFNYSKGIFPSKLIFATIWLLSDYPSQIISSRDKYEMRDRAVRGAGTIAVFFCGDFVLNNIFGRLSDKILKTQIMDRSKLKRSDGFLKKLTLHPKSFDELDSLLKVDEKVLKRTKSMGAALYWLTLCANMAILGFALPSALNRLLKNDLVKKKDQNQSLK